jgi:HK97 family phage major capsid protein
MSEILTIKQLREKIAEKTKTGHEAYEQAGEDLDFSKVTVLGEGDTKGKVEKLQAINDELADLKTDYEELLKVERAKSAMAELDSQFNKPGGMTFPEKGGQQPETKSIGTLIMESKAHEQKGVPKDIDIDLKTLFQTSAGWAPESTRIPRVELYPTRRLMVADYIPQIPTSQASIKYMEETTYTSNAAEAAEGAAAAESALALTEQSQTVEKIATFIPVTEEQLEDVPAAEAYLNSRLTYMVLARLDGQLLAGDGSTPNLLGLFNVTSIQSQAKSTDPTPDAIYKLFTLIRASGFAEPSVLFTNPTDWQDVALLRTADGIYIFGSPSDAGPTRIWGVPVVQTTACTLNSMASGDFQMYSNFYLRRGIQVEMSSGYDDYFVKGKFAVKATIRGAMVWYRPEAFGEVTGV